MTAYQKDARAHPPRPQSIGKMDWHCTRVVRNKNAALTRREFEHVGIGSAFEISLRSGEELDRSFPTSNSDHNRLIQIGIRKKADAHDSRLLMLWRARSNLAHRSGLAWASGIEDSSMACSLDSR